MREKIKMISTGTTQKGTKTGTFYTTTKNKRTKPEKLELKSFDRRAFNAATGKTGMVVLFVEGKV